MGRGLEVSPVVFGAVGVAMWRRWRRWGARLGRRVRVITDEATWGAYGAVELGAGALVVVGEPEVGCRSAEQRKDWMIARACGWGPRVVCDLDWLPLGPIPFEDGLMAGHELVMVPDIGRRSLMQLRPVGNSGVRVLPVLEHCSGLMLVNGAGLRGRYEAIWGDAVFQERYGRLGYAGQIAWSLVWDELARDRRSMWPESYCWSWRHEARSAYSIHYHGVEGKARMEADFGPFGEDRRKGVAV